MLNLSQCLSPIAWRVPCKVSFIGHPEAKYPQNIVLNISRPLAGPAWTWVKFTQRVTNLKTWCENLILSGGCLPCHTWKQILSFCAVWWGPSRNFAALVPGWRGICFHSVYYISCCRLMWRGMFAFTQHWKQTGIAHKSKAKTCSTRYEHVLW